MCDVLLTGPLETLLQLHWAEVLDTTRVRAVVSDYVLNTEFNTVVQDEIPARCARLTVTKFKTEKCGFEVWAEFTAPKGDGVVVGTLVLGVPLAGSVSVVESYGTLLVPKSLRPRPAS